MVASTSFCGHVKIDKKLRKKVQLAREI